MRKTDYLVTAARQSRYNAKHWLRYLRKEIRADGTTLTASEIKDLLECGQLTMYQRISLLRALEPGTPTNKYVTGLNQRAGTPLLDSVMRKHQEPEQSTTGKTTCEAAETGRC